MFGKNKRHRWIASVKSEYGYGDTYLSTNRKKISRESIRQIKENCELPYDNAVIIISINYMGYMTDEEFENG